MNRTKKKVTTVINADELPEKMRLFATATSKLKAIEAEIELQKQEFVKKYENRLSLLNEQREEAFECLQTYCEFHKEDLFTSKKSMELAHGVVGFRMGTPKVEKSKKVTWDGVIEELKLINPDFVRSKEEVNKELIISMRNEEEAMSTMKRIGVSVVQDEAFFVEAKHEDLVNA